MWYWLSWSVWGVEELVLNKHLHISTFGIYFSTCLWVGWAPPLKSSSSSTQISLLGLHRKDTWWIVPSPLPQRKGPVSTALCLKVAGAVGLCALRLAQMRQGVPFPSHMAPFSGPGPAACVEDCVVVCGSQRVMHFISSNDYKGRFLGASCPWWACQAAGITWSILFAFWLCLPICLGSLCVCSEMHLMLIGTNSPPQWWGGWPALLCANSYKQW